MELLKGLNQRSDLDLYFREKWKLQGDVPAFQPLHHQRQLSKTQDWLTGHRSPSGKLRMAPRHPSPIFLYRFYAEACCVPYLEHFVTRHPHGSLLCHVHVCAETSHQGDLSWLSNPAPLLPLVPSLALFFSFTLTSPHMCFCMCVSSCCNASCMRTGTWVCFGHCWVVCAWHVVCGQYLLWACGSSELPSLFSLLHPALPTSDRGLTTVHCPSGMPPGEILCVFKGPSQTPPFCKTLLFKAVVTCT